MQNVEMAKKLSTDFKLSVRTARRIHEEFSALVVKVGNDGLKFNRRKIGVEAALNALLIEFLDRPLSEQLEILQRNVPRFEAELNADPKGEAPVEHTDLPGPPPGIDPSYRAPTHHKVPFSGIIDRLAEEKAERERMAEEAGPRRTPRKKPG